MIWPYKSTKTKFWFRKGKKELLVTIRKKGGKIFVKADGDSIDGVIMDVGFTINLEEVIFEK